MEFIYFMFCVFLLINSESLVKEEKINQDSVSNDLTQSSGSKGEHDGASNTEKPAEHSTLIDKYISEFEDTAVKYYWNLFHIVTNYSASQSNAESVPKKITNKTEPVTDQQKVNGTESPPKSKQKFKCIPKNLTISKVGIVRRVNNSLLHHFMAGSTNKSTESENKTNCVVVLFYARWCSFSSAIAPHYNALGRLFPQLDVVAVDASNFKSLNTRYGIMGVPTVALFNKGSLTSVKLNDSEGNIHDMVDFVQKFSGLNAIGTVEVINEDFNGPLSFTTTSEPDYILWMSWFFIFGCLMYGFSVSSLCHWIVEAVQVNWQEVEAQHEHVD